MAQCKSCGSEVPLLARFCSSCGATLPGSRHLSDAPTLGAEDATALTLSERPESARDDAPVAAVGARSKTKSTRLSSSHALLNAGRFLPGSLLAERYRIVALL